jgi:hypothetical protein
LSRDETWTVSAYPDIASNGRAPASGPAQQHIAFLFRLLLPPPALDELGQDRVVLGQIASLGGAEPAELRLSGPTTGEQKLGKGRPDLPLGAARTKENP